MRRNGAGWNTGGKGVSLGKKQGIQMKENGDGVNQDPHYDLDVIFMPVPDQASTKAIF